MHKHQHTSIGWEELLKDQCGPLHFLKKKMSLQFSPLRFTAVLSFDVTSLFTCILISASVETVKKRLQQDDSLNDRTNFTPDQIYILLNLYLSTAYFKYNDCFYSQKHGWAMGSPVSNTVANLYMEEVEIVLAQSTELIQRSNTKPLVQICGWHLGQ